MGRFASGLLAACAVLSTVALAEAAPRRAGAGGASDQDSALVGLHDLRREGGLTCMIGHTHVGTSSGQPSRKAAEVAAQRDWASFTAWEYGSHWGNPGLAGNKTMNCSGGGSSYACEFEARPCRR
jgi:hypothetical protein